jgi:hypothetical protein
VDSVWLTGDPGGMRALAGTLRSFANAVETYRSAGESGVASMTFEGPAGSAFVERLGRSTRSLADAVTQLQGLASSLDGAATKVEQAQAEQRREEERRREEALRENRRVPV